MTLHSGEELRLESAGDLGEGNAGMLIFADGRERPEYVPGPTSSGSSWTARRRCTRGWAGQGTKLRGEQRAGGSDGSRAVGGG